MALSQRDRRAVIAFGAVAGLALVFFVLKGVLGGGGGEEAASNPPIVAGPTTQPTPSKSPKPRETLPPVALAGARDPFSPPAIFATPSGGVSPSGTSTSTSTSTETPGSSTTSPPPTAPGGGASGSLGGHTVVLVDIFPSGTKAQIEVDGTVYTVDEGDRFAGGDLRLQSVNRSCVTVSSGSDASTMCLNPQK
jgi:hypothetical protein